MLAAVDRLPQPGARAGRGRIDVPLVCGASARGGVDHVRIAGLEGEVDRAGVLGRLPRSFLRTPAAVPRGEDATLGVRAVGMAERRDIDAVWVPGMDQDARNLLAVGDLLKLQLRPPSDDSDNSLRPAEMSERISASPVPT